MRLPTRESRVCPGWVCLSLLAGALGFAAPSTAEILLNELVPSNVEGLRDINADAPDWLELYNDGETPVSLEGYGLSDDPGDPFRWTFPDVTLAGGQYLVLFASGKDRSSAVTDWDTIIDAGHSWRYLEGDSEPLADWAEVDFDDSGWQSGPSGFGFGDDDDATVVEADTVYLRSEFELDDQRLGELQGGFLHVDFDDGFVAYLNGVEFARVGFGGWRGLRPAHDDPALLDAEARLYQGQRPQGEWFDSIAQLARAGRNVLAIQGHDNTVADEFDRDLTIIPILTLGARTAQRDGVVSQLVSLQPVLMHTNFKLSADGETVSLTDPFGRLVDELSYGATPVDTSVGRAAPGDDAVVFFSHPTPRAANSLRYRSRFSATPTLTSGGFYPDGVKVTIDSEPGTSVTFTVDGSEPTVESDRYAGPISLSAPVTVVRARAFATGSWPSRVAAATYMVDSAPALPVMSVVMNPDDLFDPQTGMYVFGDDYDPEWPHRGANFWRDWERPAHFEFWESGGALGFDLDAGVKIHGGNSRAKPQRSLRMVLRSGYGAETLDYPVFGDGVTDEFQRLLLRNGGQDWGRAHLRDALIHTVVEPTGVDTLAYQPVFALVNGYYWGIYNLRERADRFTIEARYGEDDIDLLENWGQVNEGDGEAYAELIDFVRANDLADVGNYAWVESQMDTEQYAAYLVVEVFFGNEDWPDNNVKLWRPRDGQGRWRWLLVDLDFGVGLVNTAEADSLARLLNDTPEEFPAWASELARGLFRQPKFETEFINRYADYLNTSFAADETLETLSRLALAVEPEIHRHQVRWRHGSSADWFAEIELTAAWLAQRPEQARRHLLENFGLEGTYELSLAIEPPGAGSIGLTGITVDQAFTGTYFTGVPVRLTAGPSPGYRFVGWSDPELPNDDTVEVLPTGDSYTVTALFEELPPPGPGLVVHEINYNSADTFDPGDWIEFFNPGAEALALDGWSVRDDDDGNVFAFPDGTVVPAAGYLVLCSDLAAFEALFPEIEGALGNLGFGLGGGGDSVRVFDAEGLLHDQVDYDDENPWPTAPDGEGPTLELMNPALDNRLPDSWRESVAEHGSPAAPNQ